MGKSSSKLRVFEKWSHFVSKVRFVFKKGMFDLRVWPGMEGSEKTPGKAPDKGEEQMQRLAKLAKKHRNGHIPKVSNLDCKLLARQL